MKIVYLPKTNSDLAWFYHYYKEIFPAEKGNAQKHYYAIESILENNPRIGRIIYKKDIRKLEIPRTPFAFIYRINESKKMIEILRIWDERSEFEL